MSEQEVIPFTVKIFTLLAVFFLFIAACNLFIAGEFNNYAARSYYLEEM